MDSTPKLRRGLFGYRRKDVAEALIERERELRDLRREVDTLWLAFGEHDRALRRALDEPGPVARPRRFDPGQRTGRAPEEPGSYESQASTGITGSFPIAGEPGLPAPEQSEGALATEQPAGAEQAAPANGAPGTEATLARRRALAAELADLEAAMRAIEEATKALERATVEGGDSEPEGDEPSGSD